MTWSSGTFQLTDLAGECARTIQRPSRQLLLEAMTRLDERQRDELSRVPSEVDARHDDPIQDRVFAVLSNLEQRMAVLADGKMRRRPMHALGVLAQLVSEAAAAAKAAGVREMSDLSQVVRRMTEMHPQLELVDVSGDRLEVESLARAYAAWTWTDERRARYFGRIADDLVVLLDTYVQALSVPLRSPVARRDTLEAGRSLLLNLRRLVEAVPF
jgi:hypothetical protein